MYRMEPAFAATVASTFTTEEQIFYLTKEFCPEDKDNRSYRNVDNLSCLHSTFQRTTIV
jgi:hypothetical protein